MLLHTDREGGTIWHEAAYWGHLNVLQKICEWAKEDLIREEIRNITLLATERGTEIPLRIWH